MRVWQNIPHYREVLTRHSSYPVADAKSHRL
jgi:hypothetical protein